MVSPSVHPVILEAVELAHSFRLTRCAALSDAALLGGAELAAALGAQLGPSQAPRTPDPGFIATLPVQVRSHLEDLTRLGHRGEVLRTEHAELLATHEREHLAVLREAALLYRAERHDRERAEALEATPHLASAGGRALTPGEHDRMTRAETDLQHSGGALGRAIGQISPSAPRDEVLRVYGQIRLAEAQRQLQHGLLLTRQMREIAREALPGLHRGEPHLFIGETGGAKTALTEHLAAQVTPRALEFVSGYGDITSAQVIGAHELRADHGATVTEFVPGPLIRAMSEGHPIILDEINAMPAEFLKRLNRILQLRPGDLFSVQENSGQSVRIRPGFVILATANEQSQRRYRGIEQLSAELVNRFGANTFRVHYPDAGIAITELPRENLLLASAAASTRKGVIGTGLDSRDLERIARAAFISQQVFSGSHEPGFRDYVSTEREVDGRPGLEETVLAPRTMVSLVAKVVGSAGSVTLQHAVRRYTEGIMHREDRRVMTMILRGQGFEV